MRRKKILDILIEFNNFYKLSEIKLNKTLNKWNLIGNYYFNVFIKDKRIYDYKN